jgi:glycogen synthase
VTRILVLTNQYPPHHLGGYELSCRDVVDRWRQRGHDVRVLTGDWRRPGVADSPDEAHVSRDLAVFLRDGALWIPSKPERFQVERANEATLRRELARSPDVVSIWHMGAMSTGLLSLVGRSGVPAVYVVCDDWPTYAFEMDPWMRAWLRRPGAAVVARRVLGTETSIPDLDRAGTFCFVSESTRRRCREYSRWKFADSIVTYSGIDHEDFPVLGPDGYRPDWSGRLLAVGRLDPRKGFETVIRALADLPGAELTLIASGDHAYRDRLGELAAECGVTKRLRITTAERRDLAACYLNADVLLFTPEWEEPFGLVPIEAMACSTPVIATAVGGAAEFLRDGENCVTVPASDPVALAAAVRRIASDEALRRRLVAGGTATATWLSADRLAGLLEEWHLAAADHFRHGRPTGRGSETTG